MRRPKNPSWTVLVSLALHAAVAASLFAKPIKAKLHEAPKSIHMHITAEEHHAAAAPAAPEPPKAAPAPVIAAAPKPVVPPPPKAKPVEPKPKPKLAAKPQPKPAPKPQPKLAAVPKPKAPAPAPPKLAPPPPAKAPAPKQQLAAKAPPPPPPSLGEEDEGEDENEGGGDQSSEALLIHSTLQKPQYTSEALFAGLEGLFPMNVQIDLEGHVQKAQLVKKVGYGMDERIIAAVRNARFHPGRDGKGRLIAGWVKIKFKLEIPD